MMKKMLPGLLGLAAVSFSGDLEKLQAKGKKVFETYCVVCHGKKGTGDGPGAAALNPKPRDFTKGDFKFKSTPDGEPPSDADLLKTIDKGSPGTAMPPWENVLKEKQKKALVAYIKSFNPDYFDNKSAPAEGKDEPADEE